MPAWVLRISPTAPAPPAPTVKLVSSHDLEDVANGVAGADGEGEVDADASPTALLQKLISSDATTLERSLRDAAWEALALERKAAEEAAQADGAEGEAADAAPEGGEEGAADAAGDAAADAPEPEASASDAESEALVVIEKRVCIYLLTPETAEGLTTADGVAGFASKALARPLRALVWAHPPGPEEPDAPADGEGEEAQGKNSNTCFVQSA